MQHQKLEKQILDTNGRWFHPTKAASSQVLSETRVPHGTPTSGIIHYIFFPRKKMQKISKLWGHHPLGEPRPRCRDVFSPWWPSQLRHWRSRAAGVEASGPSGPEKPRRRFCLWYVCKMIINDHLSFMKIFVVNHESWSSSFGFGGKNSFHHSGWKPVPKKHIEATSATEINRVSWRNFSSFRLPVRLQHAAETRPQETCIQQLS